MKILFDVILVMIAGALLGLFALFLIDYAIAQRESESGQKAVDCIFPQNCAYFNNQKSDFFKG